MAENYQDSTLPLKTAVFGAIMGAAAVLLSKKEVRDSIQKVAQKMLENTEKKLDSVVKEAKETTNSLARQIDKKTQS
jgi:gas vesicle protein